MEKTSRTAKKKTNPVAGFFKAYVTDFGLRQIVMILLLASAIVLLTGAFIPHVTTVLVGLYGYIFSSAIGIAGCIVKLVRLHRRSPAWKRSLFNGVVLLVFFVLALVGAILVTMNGLF
jgi:hypothetical protein